MFRIRRILSLLTALLLLLPLARAEEESISHPFPSSGTNAIGCTAAQWVADAHTRAQLTVLLWQDYCAAEGVDPATGDLSASLVALSGDDLIESPTFPLVDLNYLQVVVTVGDERLSILYLPQSGTAVWMAEVGGYELSIKADALTTVGMTVWVNDPEAIRDALEE